jgi:N-acyl-D-aspartate/D-glutamate deacylase
MSEITTAGDVLVRGGTVVDGTGAPGFAADVRVRGGVIVEVGPGLAADGEHEIDAAGALVTPGFVDSHTHYDLEMFWDPTFDPLPLYGVTSTIMGNCGFGIAPVRDDTKADIADLLCFVEELPSSLTTSFPWGWPTWSSYFGAAASVPVTVTPYAFVAHNALRATVLGREAWERHATDDEIRAMCALLDDALGAGALGMSSNWFDTDRSRALVPSRRSDDRELDALCAVLAAHPGSILQTIIRDETQRLHVHRRARALGVPILSLGDGTGGGRDDGIDGVVHLGGGGEPTQPRLGFEASIATAAVPAWHHLVNGPAEQKLALLADPAWRARARHDWDNPLDEQNAFRNEQLHDLILSDPEHGPGPRGVSLADHARERDLHPSDALADWVLANGIGSRYTKRSAGRMSPEEREAQDRRLFRRDDMIFGGTDAGAHLKMFCGAGSNLYLLTHWVREAGELTVEQAVRFLSGRSTDFFSVHDRGVIEPGRRGDLNVFALDELHLRDLERAYDLPEGDYRFTRPSAGFRATIVNGVPTVLDGVLTGARPAAMAAARAAGHR